MAQRAIHLVADRWFAQLNTSVNSSVTSWVLKASGATGLPVPSALQDVVIHCGTEKALVTAIATNTPSAGLDTLTVTRGYGGSTAASHAADDYVGHYYYREHHNDLADRLAAAESVLVWLMGNAADGVVQDGGLQATQTGTPGMTVQVSAGRGIVSGQPVALRALATTATIAAPTGGNSRIDVVRIDQYGVISVVTGTPSGSPAAPSAGTGYMKLAQILLTTGMTSITNSDITITIESDGLYL
jgi:hypothetical protein